jgi:hypothetical protein
LPEASSTIRSWAVVCFLAQLCSWHIGTLLKSLSTMAAAGAGPPDHGCRETIGVSVQTDHPLGRA